MGHQTIPDSLLTGILQSWKEGDTEEEICKNLGVPMWKFQEFKKKFRERFRMINVAHKEARKKKVSKVKHRDQLSYKDHLAKKGMVLNKWELI